MASVVPPERRGILYSLRSGAFRALEAINTDRRIGPFRGQLLGAEGLATHARALGRRQRFVPGGRVPWYQRIKEGPLLSRLDTTEQSFDAVRATLTEAADRGVDISSAADWLLDNFYVVQEHIRDIRQDLPRGYYQELPKLAQGPLAGYPRIYDLAIELIAHTEGHLDLDNIKLFVGAFQTGNPLNMGELWAIPTVLRLGLVENIRRLSIRVMERLGEQESADDWAARFQQASHTSPKALTDTLTEFVDQHPPLTPVFVARLFQQIRTYQAEFRKLLWLEQWIAEESITAEDAVTRSNQRLALTQVMMANHLTSLRRIARLDWDAFFESMSVTDETLRSDPADCYEHMTFATRDRYRHVVEDIARRSRAAEEVVARKAVELAAERRAIAGAPDRTAHVGYFLIDAGRPDVERIVGYRAGMRERLYRGLKTHPVMGYFGAASLIAAPLFAALFSTIHSLSQAAQIALLVLALVPISEIAIAAVNQLLPLLIPPASLPKLNYRDDGIPLENRTVVVVPTLLPNIDTVRAQLEHLEVQFLANRGPNIHFALLTDFADAATQSTDGDTEILDAAVHGIRTLNAAYGEGLDETFYLFHRARRWNPQQGVWMGWERKRGKLGDFNAVLLGGPTDAFSVVIGNPAALSGARYVVTLDSDTTLPRESVELLVGTLAHPLNAPLYDPAAGRVVRGYGILQPRIGVALGSASRTRFAAIQSGPPGVDPYTTAVSDVYQDLFGEGSFTGKGIYEVAAFERATHGRFAENTLLSHDLIEGGFAGAALVTDIELFDDYPATYLTHARRKHRWIRGDWQLMPWLRSRVRSADGLGPNPLSSISRWKILDNMRRSLVEIAYFALLVTGWMTWPPHAVLAWSALILGAIAWPWVLSLLIPALRPPLDLSWRGYYGALFRDAVAAARQLALTVVFLPHQAVVSADAIVRTLYRVFVSRKHLLDWQSASQVERMAGRLSRGIWRRMAWALVLAVAAGGLAASRGVWAALPLVGIWLASPAIAGMLSQAPARRAPGVATRDRARALRYALLHWRFFEDFVSDSTAGLAPDNFQEIPVPVVASRTSPTNIGLHLLGISTARDLGFITTEIMLARLETAFRSLERMRRFRGHFYNWYSLPDLRVLEPAYVSTVDSGNLAGHLLALKQACLAPAAVSDGQLRAVVQAAIELAVAALAAPGGAAAATQLRATLRELARRETTLTAVAAQVRQAEARVTPAPAMANSLWWMRWVVARIEEADSGEAATVSAEASSRLAVIARRSHAYAVEMDFTVLFDRRRKLFSIGYQESTGSLDSSLYDLLASEARLASYVAVAKDDVPPEHWFRLGRALTVAGGDTALLSWSGSMFEYLMPVLVMKSLPATLLDQTHRAAVRRQIAHGRDHNLPWGMSESAYNLRDREGTYQYRAFGVPALALKRGLSKDQVVAPYATMLALMVDPDSAMENCALLEREGVLGPWGFHDAIDYTRTLPEEKSAVVWNYMAHHIGMSMVALGNALTNHVWQERFHAEPLARSAELLLGERIPRRFIAREPQPETFAETPERGERERPAVRDFDTADTAQPRVALLGAMPYTVLITNSGAGSTRYEHLAVTRWRSDSTADDRGIWCYIRDIEEDRVWSAAHQPVGAPADQYDVAFASDRVSFHRRDGEIETRLEIAVVPDDRAEVRRVTITNHSWTAREIEVTSYGEIVLSTQEADRAHPAFGNLFVETEWVETHNAILATRRPRSSSEPRLWLAHVAAVAGQREGEVSYETDRAAFIGRGRSVANPVAMEQDAPLSGHTGAVLDPIFALRVRLRVPPGKFARVAFTTLVQPERDRAVELADRYSDLYGAQRAFDLSWTRTQMELQDIGVAPADSALFQQLAGHLIYPHVALRAPPDELERNTRSQEALWAHGISGDLPILLATIDSSEGLATVVQLLQAHYYWRLHGVGVDLVILNTLPPSYLQELTDKLQAAVRGSTEAGQLDQPGGVFLRRQDLLAPDDVAMLRAMARVIVHCVEPGLGVLRDLPDVPAEYPPDLVPQAAALAARRFRTGGTASLPAEPLGALSLFNGLGGLTPELDYEIRLEGSTLPPAPWVNVIANAAGGFVVSERGGGFTWAGNSFFYRLTPWANDPVTDPPGEVVYLRDEDTGDHWSATPAPIRHETPYTVRHQAGASVFVHEHTGIETTLTLAMAPEDPVKLARLELVNRGNATRRISITSYVEWTLGVARERTEHDVRTRFDRDTGAIFAVNTFDRLFADQVAFSWMSGTLASFTADRREFIGRNRSLGRPAAMLRQRLAECTGVELDPCAALQTVYVLAPGARVEVVMLLGAAAGEDGARELIRRYGSDGATTAATNTSTAAWDHRLSAITAHTPSPEFDALVNRWTLYQALGCRMWARSALYQSSGAYGFRDQLQDGMAFVYAEPGITREHLIRAAGRQFVEGDVQHWWHPQSGRGIRTRFSDDLVWLPYCAAQYAEVTGDTGV
ncbi:MAG: glucoamylase family protein, partial [Gemmatimonadota bacterium]